MTMLDAATAGSVVGDRWLELLDANKSSLEMADVWLGDQQLLPRTPSACVVVGNTDTDLVGAPRRVEDTYNITVMIFHCKLTDNQDVERECNQRAEAIRKFMDDHDGGCLDGLVIHGICTRVEPGFANRGTGAQANWYKTSRITWQGISRYNLQSKFS